MKSSMLFVFLISFVFGAADFKCTVIEVDIKNGSVGLISNPTQGSEPCTWKLHVPKHVKALELTFLRLDLQERNRCERGYVQVSYNDRVFKVCGKQTPITIWVYDEGRDTVVDITSTTKDQFELQYRGFEKHPCVSIGKLICRNYKCITLDEICNDVCGDGTAEEKCDVRTKDSCGQPVIKPDVKSSDRILGGQEAVPGSWPWQVSIKERRYLPSGHSCGGTLINNFWIVTAAHCVSNVRAVEITIVLGGHHNFKNEKEKKIRYVNKILVHPNFNSLSRQNDIALLKMMAPVTFTSTIAPVCLPAYGQEVPAQHKVITTGWGKTADSFSDSTPLQQVELSVFEWTKCKSVWQHRLPENTICTRSWNEAPCTGDSGGPLVSYENSTSKWTLYGVVSWGSYSCGEDGKPSVYTKVSAYIPWIKSIVDAPVETWPTTARPRPYYGFS